jgi:hypothetical protein
VCSSSMGSSFQAQVLTSLHLPLAARTGRALEIEQRLAIGWPVLVIAEHTSIGQGDVLVHSRHKCSSSLDILLSITDGRDAILHQNTFPLCSVKQQLHSQITDKALTYTKSSRLWTVFLLVTGRLAVALSLLAALNFLVREKDMSEPATQ